MVRLIHDKFQSDALPPVHLTDRGLMGIRQLVLRSPTLQHLHLTLIMEAGPLVVAAWQLLLAALPETIVTLTMVCFVINHRHFVPLTWTLPRRRSPSIGSRSSVDSTASSQLHLLLRGQYHPVGLSHPTASPLSVSAYSTSELFRQGYHRRERVPSILGSPAHQPSQSGMPGRLAPLHHQHHIGGRCANCLRPRPESGAIGSRPSRIGILHLDGCVGQPVPPTCAGSPSPTGYISMGPPEYTLVSGCRILTSTTCAMCSGDGFCPNENFPCVWCTPHFRARKVYSAWRRCT